MFHILLLSNQNNIGNIFIRSPELYVGDMLNNFSRFIKPNIARNKIGQDIPFLN